MKKIYLTMAAMLLCGSATVVAQSYHGLYRPFTKAFVENGKNGESLDEYWDADRLNQKIFWLETAYHPDYKFPVSNTDAGTWVSVSSTGKHSDISPTEDKLQPALESGDHDGAVLEKTYKNLMAWVTVPAQYYKGGKLTAVPATGTVRFRIAAGGSPNRMGDTHEFHAMDMNGFYFTVCAPAGVTIESAIVSANTTQDMNDGNGACYHVPYLKMGAVTANNTVADMTMTKDNQQWDGGKVLFTFKRPNKGLDGCDAAGFPVKYFDIVFRGVKAGDVIGLGNYQTLHPGYTPVSGKDAGVGIDGAGVADITVDENAPVEYFNLQGVKVAEPANGIFIRRQGAKTEKIMVK